MIFDRIGYALGGGGRLRTLGVADHAESHHRIYTIFMVYGAEAVLPCDIIHDSPCVRMYEEKEVELDRQDNLDALEEERDVAKARSAFYQQQARRYKAEKCGPKLIILASSFYAYRRRRRTSSNPSGRSLHH